MIFLSKFQSPEFDEAAVQAIAREVERFVRAGGTFLPEHWDRMSPVEQEALIRARRAVDVERAILSARVQAVESPEDLLGVVQSVDPATAATAHLTMATRKAVDRLQQAPVR